MKKVTITLMACASLFGMNLNAQEDYRENLKFGIKAGANYSNVWDERDNDFEASGKAGFAGGAFLHVPIGKFLGVQPEVLFSQKGYSGSGNFLMQSYEFKRTTNYLEIPLLITLKPTSFLTIVAGPQYSFLLSQKTNFSSGTYEASEFEEYDNDNIRKNTLGAVVGFDINVNHFVVSPRAGWDFQTNHGDGSSSTPRYKNQWLQLTLGYRF
ncbi:hypothetical protein D3C87_197460 [compost metagenome]